MSAIKLISPLGGKEMSDLLPRTDEAEPNVILNDKIRPALDGDILVYNLCKATTSLKAGEHVIILRENLNAVLSILKNIIKSFKSLESETDQICLEIIDKNYFETVVMKNKRVVKIGYASKKTEVGQNLSINYSDAEKLLDIIEFWAI